MNTEATNETKKPPVTIAQILGRNFKRLREAQLVKDKSKTRIRYVKKGSKDYMKSTWQWGQKGAQQYFRRYGFVRGNGWISRFENGHPADRKELKGAGPEGENLLIDIPNDLTGTEIWYMARTFNVPFWEFFIPPYEWLDRDVDDGFEILPAIDFIHKHFVAPQRSRWTSLDRLFNRWAEDRYRERAALDLEPYEDELYHRLEALSN